MDMDRLLNLHMHDRPSMYVKCTGLGHLQLQEILDKAIIREFASQVSQMGFLGWDFHCDFLDKYSIQKPFRMCI